MKKLNTDISVSIPVSSHPSGTCGPHTPPEVVAPEKKLTLFAFRLAIVEKAASLIGVLAFIWATVVLLGGFANTLLPEDFWVVTFLLLVEGVRIFSRSHELQWQREAVIDASRNRRSLRHLIGSSLFQALTPRRRHPPLTTPTSSTRSSLLSPGRTWSPLEVPLLPFGGWFSVSRNVSTVFHWLQLLSALTGVGLSLWRIAEHDFTPEVDQQQESRNLEAGLLIFYGLTLAEALLFLLERAYWEVKVTAMDLFETVNASCRLEEVDLVTIKRFYYDAYSKCIDGSIFDGLKMNLVTYGEDLLVSDLFEEQLMGVRILRSFATNPTSSYDTLRKIETTCETVERLLEMLNWKNAGESDLRRHAAVVVAKLAEKEQNVIRLAAFPGAVQSVSGLLHAVLHYSEKPDKIAGRPPVEVDESSYDYSLLGLSILRHLAGDYENCEKIGGTRGLLAKIIDLTFSDEAILGGEGTRLDVVRMALLVVKILTSAKGVAGTALREQISGTVFTMSHMRRILLYGKSHPHMRRLAIEILTNLAMEVEGRERIGATGGILDLLLEIFLQESNELRMGASRATLREGAGRALAMLALESEGNCDAILRMDVLDRLVFGLEEEEEEGEEEKKDEEKVATRELLRNLCVYSGDASRARLMGVATAALPTVIQAILKEQGRSLEISIGLAAQILKLMTLEEATKAFVEACVDDNKIVEKLCQVLKHYCKPTMSEMIEVPTMRRFTIELMMQMMKRGTHHIMAFKHQDVENKLKMVLNTTSPLECFNVFTGNVGLCPHRDTIHSLVNQAIGMLSSL